jgi:hypothetical protein
MLVKVPELLKLHSLKFKFDFTWTGRSVICRKTLTADVRSVITDDLQWVQVVFFLFVCFVFLHFFITYFPQLNFQCYPQSPPHPPRHSPPPHIPIFWPWRSPVLGHIKFAWPMGLSFHWWPIRLSFDIYAARVKSSGVLLSSYCCSTYRVADPFSSLGTFSSSSIGGPVIHPIVDCEHPLLCLLGPGVVTRDSYSIVCNVQTQKASRTAELRVNLILSGHCLAALPMSFIIRASQENASSWPLSYCV